MKLFVIVIHLVWRALLSKANHTGQNNSTEEPLDISFACGGNGQLNCAYEIDIPRSCYWTKNNKTMNIMKRYHYVGNRTNGNCTIRIEELRSDRDNGVWACGLIQLSSVAGLLNPEKKYNLTCEERQLKEVGNTERNDIIIGCSVGLVLLVAIIVCANLLTRKRKEANNLKSTTKKKLSELPLHENRPDVAAGRWTSGEPPNTSAADPPQCHSMPVEQYENIPIYYGAAGDTDSSPVYATVSPKSKRNAKIRSCNKKASTSEMNDLHMLNVPHCSKENDYSNLSTLQKVDNRLSQ